MQEEVQALRAVSAALQRVERKGRFAELTLSNGIVLECRPVQPLLLNAVTNELADPAPPIVFIESKGRDEPNPNDPDYLRRLEELAVVRERAVIDLVLYRGTRVTFIPDDVSAPDDKAWLDDLNVTRRIAGLPPLDIDFDDQASRYIAWLRFYALESGADFALAEALPLQLAGLNEGEVAEAINSFRGLQERGTDTSPASAVGRENGDRANRAARRARPRARGA